MGNKKRTKNPSKVIAHKIAEKLTKPRYTFNEFFMMLTKIHPDYEVEQVVLDDEVVIRFGEFDSIFMDDSEMVSKSTAKEILEMLCEYVVADQALKTALELFVSVPGDPRNQLKISKLRK